MKIYTKTGDGGETSLIGGGRVKKNCLEIDAIGEVDELNASVGVVVSLLHDEALVDARHALEIVQHRLFTIGSNIANVQTQLDHIPSLITADIQMLEDWIDGMERDLEPLKQFILPGGHPAAAQAFLARAVCRRAERRVIDVSEIYAGLDPLVKQYLNRLSDTLFVLGRWVNGKNGVQDVLWEK